LAKQLAKELSFTYIDSGAMYRAVTLFALDHDLIINGKLDKERLVERLDEIHIRFEHNPETGLSQTLLNGKNVESRIRGIEVSENVMHVAPIPQVRKKLVHLQQEMGEERGIVMDGRDIGTVVFPDAELKLFMTASPEVRAQRRYQELKMKELGISFNSVMENIRKRDHSDTTRAADPLRQADDAVVIDNSGLTEKEQLELALSLVKKSIGKAQA
jgi:cytidylate kinase